MAAAKWTVRNYNAYLRAAKSAYGLTHHQAQQMYRSHSSRAGHSLTARELNAHPRVAAQEARRAGQGPKRALPPGGRRPGGRPGGAAIGAGAGAGAIPREFADIEDFFYDGYEAPEEDEYPG